MELKQFRIDLETQLKQAKLDHTPVRPFICSGSPFNCKIMMVGYNPAREVNLSVFDHDIWDDQMGFHRDNFAEHYDIASYNGDMQWNRNHIFQQNLIDQLCNYAVIETYLYSAITPKKALLESELKHTMIFDWLYGVIKPTLMISQNIEVIKYFERQANQLLTRNTFNTIEYLGRHCIMLPISHLSKKWGKTEVAALKNDIYELFDLIQN